MFFINPFSVWLDWPEMQHLYPYWASFVSNGCSKWLPKYYFLAIWLQTLLCPVQTWQSVTQNGGKCQYLAIWLPILLGPVQIKYPKWRKNIFFFLSTSIQTLGQFRSSWQVLNNQNGGKILLASCPVQSRPWSNPDQAGRYPKWRQNYVSFAPTMAASIVVKGITLRWTLY